MTKSFSEWLILESYLDFLTAELRLSDNTVSAYRKDVRGFLEVYYTKKGLDLSLIQRDDIVYYLEVLNTKGIAPRSVRRKLSAVRRFCRYLVSEAILEGNPTLDLESPAVELLLPKFLSTTEVDRLLAQANTETILGCRDSAMLETLYATGLRVSELVGLGISQVNLEVGFLRAWGKGKKERMVPLGDSAKEKINQYVSWARVANLEKREKNTGKQEQVDALF